MVIPTNVYPNDDYKIKAQQEYVDWLIAFKSENIYHLVLIEAKGVTGWTNKQMTSKANWFGDIFGEQGTTWPGVMSHLVIMSPSSPKGFLVEKWPHWMAPNGHIRWLGLTIPEHLKQVCRCNLQDKKTRMGKGGN